MLPGQEDQRDMQALIEAGHRREEALVEENYALKRRLDAIEQRYAAAPPAAVEPNHAAQALLQQLAREREASAGLRAQHDAVLQLLREVRSAPILEAKYAVEPKCGWPQWHERAAGVGA